MLLLAYTQCIPVLLLALPQQHPVHAIEESLGSLQTYRIGGDLGI